MDGDRLDIGYVFRTAAADVRLSGQMTIATAAGFTERLRHLEACVPATLVLDLRGVGFIDSTGLAELIAVRNRLRRDGRRVILGVAPGLVERLFALARLDGHFEIAAQPPEVSRRCTARRPHAP